MIKVKNMLGRSGKPVANQFVITEDEKDSISVHKEVFQSYSSTIALKLYIGIKGFKGDYTTIELDRDKWDYSRTTLKYLCQFLGVKNKVEIEQGIKSGKYLLTDLN